MLLSLVLLLIFMLDIIVGYDDPTVLVSWTNITMSVAHRRILSMGPGTLSKMRVVGMLGPSGR